MALVAAAESRTLDGMREPWGHASSSQSASAKARLPPRRAAWASSTTARSGVGSMRDHHAGLAIAALVVAATALSCAPWGRGSDPAGRHLQSKVAAHILSAADSFHDANGRYPDSLDELAPDLSWLPSDARLNYRATTGGYSVTIDYTPSWPQLGRSSCHYVSGASGWACHGYL